MPRSSVPCSGPMCPHSRSLPVESRRLAVSRLSLEEISEAWEYLAHLPSPEEPHPPLPPHLKSLTPLDWHVLHLLLQQELQEKDSNLLH